MPQTSLGTTQAGLADRSPAAQRDGRTVRRARSRRDLDPRHRVRTRAGSVAAPPIPTRRCSSCRPARPRLLSVTTSSSSPEPTSWSFRHGRSRLQGRGRRQIAGGEREPKRHRRADEPLDAGSARGRRLLGTQLPTAALWAFTQADCWARCAERLHDPRRLSPRCLHQLADLRWPTGLLATLPDANLLTCLTGKRHGNRLSRREAK
jgi:hypothetical protein